MSRNHWPPVMTEMVQHRISELLHIGEPFPMSAIASEKVMAFAMKLSDEERSGLEVYNFVNLIAHNQLKGRRYQMRAFRRWNRSTLKYERKNRSTVVYPSNDRDKCHLREYEILLPFHLGKDDARFTLVKFHSGYPDVMQALDASAEVSEDTPYVHDVEVEQDSTQVGVTSQNVTQLTIDAIEACMEAVRIGTRMAMDNLATVHRLMRSLESDVAERASWMA